MITGLKECNRLKKICYEIQLLKTPKISIKIKWHSQPDQKILFYVLLQSKLSQVQTILSINYGFKDLINI
jgi:hypothetical protein